MKKQALKLLKSNTHYHDYYVLLLSSKYTYSLQRYLRNESQKNPFKNFIGTLFKSQSSQNHCQNPININTHLAPFPSLIQTLMFKILQVH